MIGSKVDFSLMREASRNELVNLLDSVVGAKALVWDQDLAQTFSLIADFSFLRSHEVTKMFYISKDELPNNSVPNIIFITKPTKNQISLIYRQLISDKRGGVMNKEYHIWYVPRITTICENYLKECSEFITTKALPIYMYKLENDLATLELPLCYKDLYVHKDPSNLNLIARAIMDIQGVFGLIPTIYGKGDSAKTVFDLMLSMRRELGGNEPQVPPQIDQLIIIDRGVDLISPLATQLTYEGLIDQFFGINYCTTKLPADKFTPFPSSDGLSSESNSPVDMSETKTITLSGADPLYATLRDFNFSAVGPRLSSEARTVTSQFEQRHEAKTVDAIKKFVDKLPQMQVAKQALATQTSIAELVQKQISDGDFRLWLRTEQDILKGVDTDKISPFIEEAICMNEPLFKVLRLICLQSVVNCGLKPKVLEFYKREIINTYGFCHLLTLDNLEKAGLLTLQQTKSTYSTVRKTLRLTVDDVNESKPTDISYVHSGYAPLSVRLVEFLQWPGWRAITELLSLLPGYTLAETQQLPSALRQRRGSGGSVQSSYSSNDSGTCLVVFVGGCTSAEVSALRFLTNGMEQGGPEYVILTTRMLNGESFIKNLQETLLADHI